MENEILQQILDTQKQILNKVDALEQGQTRLEQKVTKIEVTIENEIKPSIQAVAEGHGILDRKLDDIKDIGEEVLKLQDSDKVQNIAIHELARRTANK